MTSDRQTAIAARAHQIWEEAGQPHGQDAQHWQQAEREHDEAAARAAAVERFNTEPVEVTPGKTTRKRTDLSVLPPQRGPRRSKVRE